MIPEGKEEPTERRTLGKVLEKKRGKEGGSL